MTPEAVQIVSVVVIILAVLITAGYKIVVEPRIKTSAAYITYGDQITQFSGLITDTVLRLAFSKEDLSAFAAEAKITGRDIRLVAAIHYIDRETSAQGFDFDEERIVSAVEGTLALLKHQEIIPRGTTPPEPETPSDFIVTPPEGWNGGPLS